MPHFEFHQSKYRVNNRGGIPRALYMSMTRDMNRGLTPAEMELFKRQEREKKEAIARAMAEMKAEEKAA